MTVTSSRNDAGAGAARPRPEFDLAARQIAAIVRFSEARRMAEGAAAAVARSRELRMDAARSLEVLRREHDAVVERAHEQLRRTAELLRPPPAAPRVVLAHRNAWFSGKVAEALEEQGLRIVARLDNGADAVGLAVAEQPDLLLAEDTLAMVPGEQVVRDVRRFCPDTVVVAQVAHGDRVGRLLEAGATAVFTRQVAGRDVASEMCRLLAG